MKDRGDDLETMSRAVNTLLMLAKVYLEEDMQGTDWKFKSNPDAKQALIEATKKQNQVMEVAKQVESDKLEYERKKAADISFRLGKYYEERDGNYQDAKICY